MGLLIDPKDLTQLADGISVGILPFDPKDTAHRRAFRETIYGEALIHGEGLFCEEGLEKVIEAAGLKKIIAEFIVAKIETCEPLAIGGAIRVPSAVFRGQENPLSLGSLDSLGNLGDGLRMPLSMFPTQGMNDNFDPAVFLGEHAEDTNFSRGASKILRELTANDNDLRGIGIGTWYLQERLKRAKNLGGFSSEFAQDNIPIIKTYRKFPTLIGTPEDSAVFQVTGLTPAMRSRWKMDVASEGLALDENSESLPHIFVTNWGNDNGSQKITALFTESLSTYKGSPLVRVQIVRKGPLPRTEALKDILAALLRAGEDEIEERRWASSNIVSLFTGAAPVFCIHVLKEREIVEALGAMDAPFRRLGTHRTLPSLMSNDASKASPLRRVRASDKSWQPLFGIAA